MLLFCCLSVASANEGNDGTVAVSQDIAIDEVTEVDSGDGLSSVSGNENGVAGVNDDNLTSDNNENLGQSNVDESLNSYNDIDWSECNEVDVVGDIDSTTFPDDNTIYIFDGEYGITDNFDITGENILLKSNDGTLSTLTFTTGAMSVNMVDCSNFAVKNIKFTYVENERDSMLWFSNSNNILFENCVFENMAGAGLINIDSSQNVKFLNCTFNNLYHAPVLYLMAGTGFEFINCSFENMFRDSDDPDNDMNVLFTLLEIDDLSLINCNFSNCDLEKLFRWEAGEAVSGLINITDSNFKNIDVNGATLNFDIDDGVGSIDIYLENNSVDSYYAIGLNGANLISKAYLHVLNNESLYVGEKSNVVLELVDDKNNRIYSPDLKVFGKKPSFSSTTGLYTLQYTPDSMGVVPVEFVCSNIGDINGSDAYLKVKELSEITLNYTNITYGGVFNVNATLKDDISNENVTFRIINSTGDVIDSKDVNVAAGFASASFENLPAGDWYVNVTYAGNDKYGSSSAQQAFKIFKADQTMALITNLTVFVNDDIIIKAVLSNSTTGNVTFRLETSEDIVPVSGMTAETQFLGLSQANDYTIFVTYSGDDNYNPCEKNVTISVREMILPFLNILNSAVVPGEDIIITIKMNEEINDNVTVTINTVPEVKTLINGTATVIIPNVKANEIYTINVDYAGYGQFKATSNSTTLTVNKLITTISASANPVKVDDDVEVIVHVDSNATGTVLVDGQYPGFVDGGSATVTIPGLSNGTYTFDVVYSGDDKFNGNQTTVTVVVEKIETSITVNVDDIELGQVASISVGNLPAGATGNLTFSNIGLDPVTLGVGETYKVSNLVNGTYNVFVTYSGDGKYAGSSANKTFTVKYVEMVDETAISGINSLSTGNNVVGIKLPSNATGTLTVIVDGTSVNATLVNGVANIPISGLSAGKHNITVIYSGDGNYSGYTSSQIVEVAKIIPKATVSAPSKITSGKSATVKINLPSDATGYVVVEVQGKKYDNIKVVNGVATVNIAGLKAGNPVLKYTYKGNAKYASKSGSTKLKVVDPKVTITIKKVKVKKSAKKLVLQSIVKIDGKTKKGLKVTFKFNGKKIGTAKTTAKGVAKITIKKSVLKKLKVGKKVTYTATYGKKTAKVTVKVKK